MQLFFFDEIIIFFHRLSFMNIRLVSRSNSPRVKILLHVFTYHDTFPFTDPPLIVPFMLIKELKSFILSMQQTMSRFKILPLSIFLCLVTLFLRTESFPGKNGIIRSSEPLFSSPLLVKKDQRTPIVTTEYGEISAVQIGDGYHLQYITLEPNALLLPLLLHSDMVFFVHTGTSKHSSTFVFSKTIYRDQNS